VNHHLCEYPSAPALGFSARGGEIGPGQDATKKGGGSSGKHLAKSLEAAGSANEASPAIFFLQKKYVLQNA